jgi:hypothetical protein
MRGAGGGGGGWDRKDEVTATKKPTSSSCQHHFSLFPLLLHVVNISIKFLGLPLCVSSLCNLDGKFERAQYRESGGGACG